MAEELDGIVEDEPVVPEDEPGSDDVEDAEDDTEDTDSDDGDDSDDDDSEDDADAEDDKAEEDEEDLEKLRRDAQSWKDKYYSAVDSKEPAEKNMSESERRKGLIEYASSVPYLSKKLNRIYDKYYDPDDLSDYAAEMDIFIGEVDIIAKQEYERFVQHTEKIAEKSKNVLSEYDIKPGSIEYSAVKKELLKAGIDLDNPVTMASHEKKLLDYAIATTAQKIKSTPKVNVKDIGKKRNGAHRPKAKVVDASGGSAIPGKITKFNSFSEVSSAHRAGRI